MAVVWIYLGNRQPVTLDPNVLKVTGGLARGDSSKEEAVLLKDSKMSISASLYITGDTPQLSARGVLFVTHGFSGIPRVDQLTLEIEYSGLSISCGYNYTRRYLPSQKWEI